MADTQVSAAEIYEPPSTRGASSASSETHKRCALLVGIDSYGAQHTPNASRAWGTLSGTGNDLQLLAQVLAERHGFRVALLKNHNATRAGIEAAFKAHLIDCITGPGDAAFFHFSGHGQQVPDKSGDETDGLDESIVPYDNLGQTDWRQNVLDDTFEGWLKALAKKTDNITISFDSCHSGTATRGATLTARGSSHQYEPAPTKKATEEKAPGGWMSDGELPYTFLAAADSSEFAYEKAIPNCRGEGCVTGQFSYHLASQLAQAPAGASYSEVLSNIRAQMLAVSSKQHPQIHGQAHRTLFGTSLAERPMMSYALGPLSDPKNIRVDAGLIHGLSDRHTLNLYGQDQDIKGSAPLAQMALHTVESTMAYGALVEGSDISRLEGKTLRAIGAYTDKGAMRLRVEGEVEGLSEALANQPFVSLVTDDDWTLRVRPCESGEPGCQAVGQDLVLEGRDGQRIGIPTSGQDAVMSETISAQVGSPSACVLAALESHFKRSRLLAITNQDPSTQLRVSLRLSRRAAAQSTQEPLSPGINDSFGVNQDFIGFEIENHEDITVHVALLELGPGGAITHILPPGKEMSIAPKEVWRFESKLFPPYGDYTFKLVATDSNADFSPLAFKAHGRCEPVSRPATRGGCEGVACLFDSMGPRTRGMGWGAQRPRWTTRVGQFSVVK
jgi:hypothetical protein